MKKKFILLPLCLAVIYVIGSSYSGGAAAIGGVDGSGATSAGGCSCHTSAASTTVTIELDTAGGTAVTHYVAGGNYTIKITGTNTSSTSLPKFGFQVAAVKLAGAGTGTATNAGTLASTGLPAFCQNSAVGSINVVEHTTAITSTTGTGGSGTTYVISSIPWTAPTAGTGSVKLYGVINAVDGTGGTGGDKWRNTNVTITELTAPVAPITGTLTVCVGANTTLADATTGGTWSSGTPSVATVTTGGVVHGVSPGTTVISYNAGTAGTATATVTVSGPASAGTITGISSVCIGSTITLSNATATGTGSWSTTTPLIAIVNASTGAVTGIATGTANIVYTATATCGSSTTSASVPVITTPVVAAITGGSSVCVGSSFTLSDVTASGVWSSGSPLIATVTTSGMVTGLSAGSAIISYTVSNTCGATNALQTVAVTALPNAGSISGSGSVCAGNTITLTSSGFAGGTWISSTPAVATVNSSTGAVTGVGSGTTTITYNVTNSCGFDTATYTVTGGAIPNTDFISGIVTFCTGTAVVLHDPVSGGVWTIANPAVATVTSAASDSATITGVSAGSTTVTYTATNACGSHFTTRPLTIEDPVLPGIISGPSTACPGDAITYFYTASLGSGTLVRWHSISTTVATVGLSTGSGTALASGSTFISLAYNNACSSDSLVVPLTVNPAPNAGTITGGGLVCVGSILTLTDVTTGGVWSSGTPSIATVNSAGVVTGVAGGTAIISYGVTNSCGTAFAIHTVVVQTVVSAGSISGLTAICAGTTTTLSTSGTAGGTWLTNPTSVATISPTGILTGVSAGTANVTYIVTNSCSTDTTHYSVLINPAPNAGTISGASGVCTPASITLTDAVTGGTWSSGTPSLATVNSSGVVTGLGTTTGVAVISYSVTNSCGTAVATHSVTVTAAPNAGTISGPTAVCAASSVSLTSTVTGGTWTISPASVATINGSGVVTGISSGTANITYTVTNTCGSATATYGVLVNPLPVAGSITGAGSVCVGSTVTLSDLTTGGTWSSGATSIATVNASGVVSGVTAGTAILSYTVTNGCGTASAIHTVVVNGPPSAGTISGSAFVCVGTSSTLSSTATGGTWSSSNSAIVTISPSGVATGVGTGSVTISYSVAGTCGTGVSIYTVSSGTSASAGTITGPTSVCVGAAISLVDLAGGGVWSSSAPSVATINALGVVSGVSGGTTTISYTVTTACGTAVATYGVLVNPLPVAGFVSGPVNVCVGSSVSLAASVSGGVWSSTAPGTATVDASGNFTGVTPGTFIVVYTVSNGCGSVTALHTMISNAVPGLAVISGATTVCQGATTPLTSSLTGGFWTVSNGAASVSTTGLLTGLSYGVDTVYYVIANICDTTIASHIDTVYPTNIAGGIVGSNIACIGDTFQYAVSVPGGTFMLSNGNAVIDPVTGTLIPVSAGLDTLTYSLTNICGTSSASMTINVLTAAQCATVGVNNVHGLQGIRIFPNPTDGIFTLEMPEMKANAVVTITDVFGKVIETRMIDAGSSNTSFDLSSLAAGSYMIKITSGDHTFRDKIVIW
ncbi:hypothetical protein CJD36_021595 [Flavipsychrobacter stenotrophus]|uniref:BIG2 domain-containing protein n=1 Tax=Flavipsychrobacter stenotrophus TaxID=2077091 RepID=A0A2S7SQ31_9BACT|nr:T9SS type A sorting domain-containing protein [Flavipsychrobacter stenotrophus]PQJ09002.1 hypothetical protein CJD36_021595 [Flavipsychrobacter stenotrophus]